MTRSEKPLVSIIIPCWNAERYVWEAIRSALVQTYPNIEVIVIDDGSTDGSLEVIRFFEDRIRWKTGPKYGGSSARNLGLAMARGELIQFLDADDLLFPEKLEKMVPLAVEHGPGVTDICDWERIFISAEAKPQAMHLNYNGEDPVLFCLRNQLPTPSPLHWKSDLDKVKGFDETLPCSQERDLHLRLACIGISFVYLPKVLYQVRRRTNSVSDDYSQVLRQHGRIFNQAFQNLQKQDMLSEKRAIAFAEAVARDARQCMQGGDSQTAKLYFRIANSMHPDGALKAFRRPGLRIAARLLGAETAERLCQVALRIGFHP